MLMNIDRIIAVVSSVATLFATIIVLFTLLEMRKQRKGGIKPELTISNTNFYCYADEIGGVILPIWWSPQRLKTKDLEDLFVLKDISIVSLKLYNIGLWAAKELEFVWDYDIESMLRFIEAKDDNKVLKLEFTKKEHDSKGVLLIRLPKMLEEIRLEDELSVLEEYCLPAQIITDAKKVDLPRSYVRLLSMIVYISINSGIESLELINEIPPLKLTIKYHDIEGKIYKKKYSIRFYLYGFYNIGRLDKLSEVINGAIKVENEK